MRLSYAFPPRTGWERAIDEDKLTEFTALSKGQNAALKHVTDGNGVFELRSDIEKWGLYKGDTITVTNYIINSKEF